MLPSRQRLLTFLLAGMLPLGATCFLPFVSAKDAGWEVNLKNGRQALESGNYGQAETYLSEALVNSRKFQTGDPRLGTTYHCLADLYVRQEKYSLAKEYYERAIVIEQKSLGLESLEVADALYGLSLCAQQTGDHLEAEILLKRVMEIWKKKLAVSSKQYLSILPSLAAYASMKGDYKTSEAYYRQLLSLYEQDPGAGGSEIAACQNRLSAVLGLQGKYAEAETMGAQALALLEKKPDDEIVLESARMNLAFMKAQNASPSTETGVASPGKAVRSVSGQVVKGQTPAVSAGDKSLLLSAGENVNQKTKSANPAVTGTSDADASSADKTIAAKTRADERPAGGKTEAKEPEGRKVAAGNNWGKIRYLSEGRLISQEEYKAMMLATEAYELLKLQKYRMANYILTRALQTYPQLPAAHTNLGLVLTRQGRYDEAVAEFKKAIELDPKRPAPWLNLASTYQVTGNLAESISVYKQYVEKFPAHPLAAQAKVLMQNLLAELNEQQQVPGGGVDGADYINYASAGGAVRWASEKMPVKVYIEQHPHLENFKKEYAGFMQQAMRDWSEASNGVVKFEFVTKPEKADIACAWSGNLSDVACPAEGGQTTLVLTKNGIKRADIVILTSLNARSGQLPDNIIKEICLHEVGHALGIIGHSPLCKDVMFCTMPLADSKIELSGRDHQTLAKLYSEQLAARSVPAGEITLTIGQRPALVEAEK